MNALSQIVLPTLRRAGPTFQSAPSGGTLLALLYGYRRVFTSKFAIVSRALRRTHRFGACDCPAAAASHAAPRFWIR